MFCPSDVSHDGNLSFISPHQRMKPSVMRMADDRTMAQEMREQNASRKSPRKELSSSLWYNLVSR